MQQRWQWVVSWLATTPVDRSRRRPLYWRVLVRLGPSVLVQPPGQRGPADFPHHQPVLQATTSSHCNFYPMNAVTYMCTHQNISLCLCIGNMMQNFTHSKSTLGNTSGASTGPEQAEQFKASCKQWQTWRCCATYQLFHQLEMSFCCFRLMVRVSRIRIKAGFIS